MRLLEVIPYKQFRISIYSHDLHYYVEIEGGPMKQCFRFTKELAPADKGGVRALLDEEFFARTKEIFDFMHQNFKNAIERQKS
ncbi:hypothetical protein [Schleiferia thermophila]|uniref:Uncharacterized protein n=1 Tax=Schleiferia thermophila TaxID=884107 RepID=A0A369A7F6_9FLAO|nr:hypothetical protein [Schleiferia thermophila]RCX05085.1 hypothetical protein DES35_101365 [Schleiferia thermophila]GCD79397.1 hypothetical protein JCM30197_06440 [Schleiferia thermophila]